ncbi:hypothetical protein PAPPERLAPAPP_02830 [Brevundimonas phage vB_BpoS-Papperlapapp]|uniref:Uncharacterized protein n=1 Tax=Brevundimonas phage vB_BpoS-Domovoi TaxID=2948598 RepID=A0A9E7MQT8_9CAUD|nr:hypothetical protein DOMOVOI_01790 [Brevundimonas phage vB_BpoS-Domovoi]USN16024.1 hypothetical protein PAPPERLAPAPP_02830 [Brevundimonas phage vB_BpoS-Papperlapapp]
MTAFVSYWTGPMPRQLKDIPDLPIVQFVTALDGVWGTWCWTDTVHADPQFWFHSVAPLFPEDIPEKLLRGKMANLIRRGLIDGCPCGCRGDYEATDKGRAFVAERLAAGETGCAPEMLERARLVVGERRR